MIKVILYSIRPEHLINILNGKKQIEIRRRDLPQWAKDKLDRGEIVQGYGYCTKGKPLLVNDYYREKVNEVDWEVVDNFRLVKSTDYLPIYNGLVVVKFQVSGTTKYVDCSDCTNNENGYECENDFMYLLSVDPILRKATCLEADELEAYGNGADLYAHHFTNIQPIEPMELSEFVSDKLIVSVCGNEPRCWSDTANYFARKDQRLTKAPQSFMTAWVKEE